MREASIIPETAKCKAACCGNTPVLGESSDGRRACHSATPRKFLDVVHCAGIPASCFSGDALRVKALPPRRVLSTSAAQGPGRDGTWVVDSRSTRAVTTDAAARCRTRRSTRPYPRLLVPWTPPFEDRKKLLDHLSKLLASPSSHWNSRLFRGGEGRRGGGAVPWGGPQICLVGWPYRHPTRCPWCRRA